MSDEKKKIFECVPESKTEGVKTQVEEILKETMKTDINPKEVYRRGRVLNEQRPRAVTVRFKSVQDKNSVLRKTYNLKEKGIRINEDLPLRMLD